MSAGLQNAGPPDLRGQTDRLLTVPRLRAEHLCALHNPWGFSAGLADPWSFLAFCEHPATVREAGALIGDDVVLWDSQLYRRAEDYAVFVSDGREGRYWPADPCRGAVVVLAPETGVVRALAVPGLASADLAGFAPETPLYVVRYMSARSLFRRDEAYGPNRLAAEEQILVNYTTRPLWIVSGEDRAGNNFVTGFMPALPRWAGPAREGEKYAIRGC